MESPNALKNAFAPIFSLSQKEWLIGTRSSAFRLLAVCAALLGFAVGGSPGRGAGQSAYEIAESAWQNLGFVAIAWVSISAVRESLMRTDRIVFSKPQPVERLVLAKFLGAYGQVLALLLAMFAGGILSHLFAGGGVLGSEVYIVQYLRAACVLFFASSVSFCLALLSDSAIVGVLTGLFWILTLTGKTFLGKIYFPAYSQNQSAYFAFGAAALFASCLLFQRSRRGSAKPPIWLQWCVPICLFFSFWQFYAIQRDGHDIGSRQSPMLELTAQQDTEVGNAASGMLLPDQNNRLVGLSDYPGKILVIALWSPLDADSAVLLERLNSVQEQYASRGVQAIAIAISPDNGAAKTFARGGGLNFPVLTDWGTYNTPRGTDLSPISAAYQATSLPRLVVTDRRRRAKALLSPSQSLENRELDAILADLLKAEPK